MILANYLEGDLFDLFYNLKEPRPIHLQHTFPEYQQKDE